MVRSGSLRDEPRVAGAPRLYAPADHGSEPPVRGWLRRMRASGFQPVEAASPPVTYVLADGTHSRQVPAVLAAIGEPYIGFIAPTYVTRAGRAEHAAWVAHLVDQLSDAVRAHDGLRVVLFIGMQWLSADERAEALARLTKLVTLAAPAPNVCVVGLALEGPGKTRTINAAVHVAERAGIAGLGWCDDDVRLEPRCLRHLIGSFLSGGARGAVGATKIPHATGHATSRVLLRVKAVAAPATNYPHGCCMLVAPDVIAGGIPDRYVCDDGYVCFRLLDPASPDPLRDLRLVPEARCHYYVAGPAGPSRRKIRRMLLNHHIYLADWPTASGRYYLRHVLFAGMWPLSPWDGRRGVATAVLNAVIKWIYFMWFAYVGVELFLRGLLRRPLHQVEWAGYRVARQPQDERNGSGEASP